MALYKPGDTRMLTVFRMLSRVFYLMDPLIAMFNDPEYTAIAQKCIKNYNSNADATKNFKKRNSDNLFNDIAETSEQSSPLSGTRSTSLCR